MSVWDSVRCLQCSDMGYVRCYSPQAMADAVDTVRGRRGSVRVSFCDVPCTCQAGDEAAEQTHRILKKIARHNDVKVPIRANDHKVIHVSKQARVDHVAVLMEWARGFVGVQDEVRAAREAPYQVFEDWNKQPF